MSAHSQTLAPLEAVVAALEAGADRVNGREVHVRAYSAWIAGESRSALIRELAAFCAVADEAGRTYREVAALGYAATARALDEQGLARLTDGIEWLSGRSYFVANRPRAFEADGVALLGVALGVRAVDTVERPRLEEWVSGLAARAVQDAGTAAAFDIGLARAAMVAASATSGSPPTVEGIDPVLAVALASRGVITARADQEDRAFTDIMSLGFLDQGAEQSATFLAALRWLVRAVPTALPKRATVDDVVELLTGIQRSLKRWTWESKPTSRGATPVKWRINNEYHVQNLLWIVLAPVFPDLEDEENLPSLGQKHPRADVGIPSLKLIVEAKFVYDGSNREFAAIIGQVAEDASLYLTRQSEYTSIIPFVWDGSGHTEQHAELIQGLLKIRGIVGAVVVSRPGRMQGMMVPEV